MEDLIRSNVEVHLTRVTSEQCMHQEGVWLQQPGAQDPGGFCSGLHLDLCRLYARRADCWS